MCVVLNTLSFGSPRKDREMSSTTGLRAMPYNVELTDPQIVAKVRAHCGA